MLPSDNQLVFTQGQHAIEVNQQLVSQQGQDVLHIIRDYARTWSLLQRYDEQQLPAHTLTQHDMRPLLVDTAQAAIALIRRSCSV